MDTPCQSIDRFRAQDPDRRLPVGLTSGRRKPKTWEGGRDRRPKGGGYHYEPFSAVDSQDPRSCTRAAAVGSEIYEVRGRSSARAPAGAPVTPYEKLKQLLKRLEQLGDDVGYEARTAEVFAEQLARELENQRARMRDV